VRRPRLRVPAALRTGALLSCGRRAAREAAPARAAARRARVSASAAGRAPIEWETPTGKPAMVNMELQLSAFFGYGKAAEDAYLGLQCHGVLWPAVTAEAPVHWPIAPPIVSGKVPHAHPPCSGCEVKAVAGYWREFLACSASAHACRQAGAHGPCLEDH